MKTEHILIIRFSAIGDVAMAVPVVYSLATQYPHVRITVLSKGFARPLFENLAPNVSFMEADIKTEYHGLRGLNSLFRRLKAKHFTSVADFHNVLRSDYLRMRFNMDRFHVAHINKHRKGKRRLVSTRHKRMEAQPTSFQNYADVLAKLGYPVNLHFDSIFPPEGGDVNLLPPSLGLTSPDSSAPSDDSNQRPVLIGIAPFAAHPGKIYPQPLMQQVIEQLCQQLPDCRIFLFGGGEREKRIIDNWCNLFGNCVNASRKCGGLMQELILMSHLNVMLSMDSANMHLASLTHTPVVSIWGATHPYAGFMGWNQSLDNAIQMEMDCRPCSIYGNKRCKRGNYPCLNGIKPQQIVEKIIEVTENQNIHP